ncbi:hypothetical protein RFI_10308 [Reticulomyxa filosa]|uniref:Nucleotide-diphospho-sugar transferase domain-containing protein n=1 Tax=Reticulomyxa filosa TaxID=46433 RepID=X6NKI3_RETFI|nr:hypothetical protein RFI_10308 [Reticulomyxa filosa]|eukprot:ETO26825.1 hypothetical protein RFI_10308 [Reticulomyxa filosa]
MVAFQIIYTFDLIALGYDVIMQDADVVWLKDLRKYERFGNQEFIDIEMSFDNLALSKSIAIAKPKSLWKLLLNILHWSLLVDRIRLFGIIFLREDRFRALHIHILSSEDFVGGWQWSEILNQKSHSKLPNRQNIWFIHASWTDEHLMKIPKLKLIRAWFFDETCQYFNKDFLPRKPTQMVHENEIFDEANDFQWNWEAHVKDLRARDPE